MNATITNNAALNRVIARRTRDRRLAITIAVFVPLVIFIGFARSYYLKGLFGFPPLPSLLVHVHSIIMTAWVGLFVVQVWLVAAHRTRLHMKLGILGSVLALLVFIVGILTSLEAAARGSTVPPFEPLSFLVIPLGDIFVFAVLVGGALYFRRKLDTHKRLMFLSALNLMPAAVARIPLDVVQTYGPLAFYGFPDLCVIALVAYDTMKNRRLHPAYFVGSIIVIASHPLRLMFANTDAWISIAGAMVSLVK